MRFTTLVFCWMVLSSPFSIATAESENFALDRGNVELQGFGGWNRDERVRTGLNNLFGSQGVERPYTVGGEAAVGINRYLAITGTYAYDRLATLSGICLLGGTNCGQTVTSRSFNEYMGGVRVTGPMGRLSPYGALALGGLSWASTATASSRVTGNSDSTSFAIAVGGGVRFALTRHLGLTGDVRAVVPFGPNANLGSNLTAPAVPSWMVRATGGAYVQFGGGGGYGGKSGR